MMAEQVDRGRSVLLAGTGINLALGVLYTWSIFKEAIRQSIETGGRGSFGWDLATLNDPYAVCCLVFACAMILAGKCQDVLGPRWTAMTGGLLVGLGFIWVSGTTSYLQWILGFGVVAGTGIAFGYSSATPAALKWFAPTLTGRIAGIVVSGFGLASVYIAPLATYLLGRWGLRNSMLFFGAAFLVVVGILSFFLVNPPHGYVPKGFVERRAQEGPNAQLRAAFHEASLRPMEMLRTSSFWLLWVLYFIGAGAGLMVIGNVAGMAKKSMGSNAFLAVAILAIGNAAGRIVAGMMSDRLGRRNTLAAMFFLQALLMFAAIPVTNATGGGALLVVLLATFIGFNYGANLALFPSFSKDLYGMKSFGINYGLLFTSWGVGGFIMSRVSQSLLSQTGSFSASFIVAGVLLFTGTAGSFLIRGEKEQIRERAARLLAAQTARP